MRTRPALEAGYEAAAICREPWFQTVHQTKSSKTRLPSCLALESPQSAQLRPHLPGALVSASLPDKVFQNTASILLAASQVARLQGRTPCDFQNSRLVRVWSQLGLLGPRANKMGAVFWKTLLVGCSGDGGCLMGRVDSKMRPHAKEPGNLEDFA